MPDVGVDALRRKHHANGLVAAETAVGNVHVSLYGMLRLILFGSVLFWLGRLSNRTGQDFIRRQEQLEFRTREVASKIFQVSIVTLVGLLLLQLMGVSLTALAVFGGALGVGLGFGLQSIASNFISRIIIPLDRSVSVDDYIPLEDGRTGIVRELNMRSTTLETFDGKDVMVPNEKFIVETFTNWTHKDKKQRYRIDFQWRTSPTSGGWSRSSGEWWPVIRRSSAATPCRWRSGRIARSPASVNPASICSSSSGWRASATGGTGSAAT